MVDREPLPYCGFVDETPRGPAGSSAEHLIHDDGAGDCFLARWQARSPAELIRASPTIEGDIVVMIQRVTNTGEAELYVDFTDDNFGTGRWERYECAGFDAQGPTECS
ncbi:MAG: hypothetical protein AAFN30_13540 [Actinomycetota bacterium]